MVFDRKGEVTGQWVSWSVSLPATVGAVDGQSLQALHQLLLGAIRTQDVALVRDEAFADERATAHCADEAFIVPVAVLERDEAGATDPCRECIQSARLPTRFSGLTCI